MKVLLPIIVLSLLLFGCDKTASIPSSDISVVDYGFACGTKNSNMIVSNKKYTQFGTIIDGVNALLKDVSMFTLTTRPESTDNNAILVQVVDIFPPEEYRLAQTDTEKKCILIDASLLYNALFHVAGKVPPNNGENEDMLYLHDYPAYTFIMIYILLHEVGHIQLDRNVNKEGFDERINSICKDILYTNYDKSQKSKVNADCSVTQNSQVTHGKSIEILADKFAAYAIKTMIASSTNEQNEKDMALRVNMSLYLTALNIITKHAEQRLDADVNGPRERSRETFLDEGMSHPNIELRLLLVFAELNPTYEYMVDDFLRSRAGDIPKDSYNDFSAVPTKLLLKKFSDAKLSWSEKMTVVELLGDRKAKEATNELVDQYHGLAQIEKTIGSEDHRTKSWVRSYRNELITSLARIQDPVAIPIILESIKSTDYTTRVASVEAVGILGLMEAIDIVLERAKDVSRLEKLPAIEALGKLHARKAFDTLISLLEEESYIGLEYVVKALVEHQNPEAISYLHRRIGQGIDSETGAFLEAAIISLQQYTKSEGND